MRFKTGLIHPPHTIRRARRMMVMARHLDKLGSPPETGFAWHDQVEKQVGGPDKWGMLLNDQLGDCVIADDLHFLMVCLANGSGPFRMPSDGDAEALYERIAGYVPGDPSTDYGTDPSVNLHYMMQTGVLGQTYEAGATIDAENANNMMWGCHIFGGLRFCINCPDIADDMYDRGIWDYNGEPYRIEGGHDIRAVSYDTVDGEPLWEIVTWGRRIKMTASFWKEFGTSAEADLASDIITAQGTAPTGLDINAMIADLQAIQ